MVSGSFWQKWRGRFLALFFIVQYHFRMSLLTLRFKARRISRGDIDARARASWHSLCQAFTSHHLLQNTRRKLADSQVTAVLRLSRQKWDNERFQSALHAAKKRLEEVVFTEEEPTRPLDLSKLKTAWHSLETSKLPRVTSEMLKTGWHSFETGTLPSITPKKLKAVRHPWKALKAFKHPRIMLFTLGVLSLLLVTLFTLVATSPAFNTLKTSGISTAPQFIISELHPVAQQGATTINASKALTRISQLDASEYASQSEYNVWAYSACSTASMTEVFNAYGRHYRITDVLKVESALGEITPQLGLLENVGIANTAAKFGFQTTWGNNWTLAQVEAYANAGHPVIVGWPPARYDGGHIVVVLGGDASTVYLADSSLWNRHALSVTQFMQWWGGFAAVVTPE
jgi:hypothetical protein